MKTNKFHCDLSNSRTTINSMMQYPDGKNIPIEDGLKISGFYVTNRTGISPFQQIPITKQKPSKHPSKII